MKIRCSFEFRRWNSSIIPNRLFEAVKKSRNSKIVDIPDNLPIVSPQPNPPIFDCDGEYQLIKPYLKKTYSQIFKTNKNNSPLTVLDMFEKNFIGRNLDFYKKQINEEMLWVLRPNYKVSSYASVLKTKDFSEYEKIIGPELHELPLEVNDIVVNYACIHELKVSRFFKPEIIFEDKHTLVINKPVGIPVHPSGMAYRFNTLLYLLGEAGYGTKKITKIIDDDSLEIHHKIWPCHRLDKDTSGVLIFAKNPTKCSEISKILESRKGLTKKYIALVHGKFSGVHTCKGPIVEVDPAKKYENGGIGKKIQFSKTNFEALHYDKKSDTTLIECKLFTGRKHQIRQHLRSIGFHIVNDPLYGINGILKKNMANFPVKKEFLEIRRQYEDQLQQRREKWEMESVCSYCSHITYNDPNSDKDETLRLHSIEYTYQPKTEEEPLWSYKSKLPNWALDILPANKNKY